MKESSISIPSEYRSDLSDIKDEVKTLETKKKSSKTEAFAQNLKNVDSNSKTVSDAQLTQKTSVYKQLALESNKAHKHRHAGSARLL